MMSDFRLRTWILAAVLSLALLPAPIPAEWDVDGLEELLPRAPTEDELLLLEEWKLVPLRFRADPPPLAPIRNCAEWEPSTGVLIRYPLGLPYNLLRDFDDDVILHVIVSSSSYSSAVSNFVANGVDTSRVQWLIAASNSIWTRDYGPWWVFDGYGDIGLIDHKYNRPRPQDDAINGLFGAQQGIPVYYHGMVHTGGNYMTDGEHTSMSTDLVYDEAMSYHGMTPAQVDQLMEDYLGIATYYVVDDISSGGIHHIDTWAKFLDEENVLIKQVWTSHYTYAALEQRATLIASLQASTGRNYNVHRVYCYNLGSEPAAYTNSLILNRKIYVPFFGNSTYDNQAINAYRAAAPGYTVAGYSYSGFLTDDALHCRAMGVADRGMLRVSHVPIEGVQTGPVSVTAFVDDRSETGISLVDLSYRFAGESWETVPMSAAGGDLYEGEIPSPPESTTVDYFIHAEDNSGREEGMPRTEPAAWYTFPIRAGIDTEVLAGAPDAPARLHPNAPNPFNPSTVFRFDLKYPERVELFVFDARGRLVRRLVEGERAAGAHEVVWDGTDEAGREVPSGVYVYRLRAAGISYARPAVLVR
ncbi:MAG: agmatine deiminase family protein [Candidatus Eisenbacteria bacterium]|nr:agmatine deiminase family protein [Candidatus Eisenbacteria bacterium]